MTITQIVEIPADRRITLEVPRETPIGKAQVEVKVIPFVKKEEKLLAAKSSKIRLTKEIIEEMEKNSPTLNRLTGILHTDMTIGEIRKARLAKHI